MTLTAKVERLAAEIQERALLAYGVLISALDNGESIDPVAAYRIIAAAGKRIEDLNREREMLALAREFEETITDSRAMQKRAMATGMVGVNLDCIERVHGSRRVIAEIGRQVFGEYEAS